VNPVFRLATENDAELLLGMMREYYAYRRHAYYEPRARTALLKFLREPTYGQPWLICDQDTTVGYIVLTFGYSLEYLGRHAFIDEFLLVPSDRGRGLGVAPPSTSSKMPPAAGFAPSIWRSSAQTPEPKRFTCDPDISVTSTV
jgi:hypothetical protein